MENQVIATYGEFRDTLKDELQKSAEGFVRIGYLLKVARETNILNDSEYESVNDFAKAEFGLTKDQVSRFIAINERFSEGGNSERLEEKYAAFGYAKLTEILTLPDEVIGMLSPEMTRKEIQDVKKEIKEEEKIKDLEVIMEGQKTEQKDMNNLQKALHQFFYEQRDQYLKLAAVIKGTVEGGAEIDEILNVLAPSGIAVKTVRVQGIGRLMLSFKGKDNNIELLNTRSNEKEDFTWTFFIYQMRSLFGFVASKELWSEMYGEPFDVPKEITEVAPVQQNETVEKQQKTEKQNLKEEKSTENETTKEDEEQVPETLHDVNPDIPKPGPIEPRTAENDSGNTETEGMEEEQIPGQDSIVNHPEYMPQDDMDKAVIDKEHADIMETENHIIDGEFKEVADPEYDLKKENEWLITDLTSSEAIAYITKFILQGVRHGKVRIIGKIQK